MADDVLLDLLSFLRESATPFHAVVATSKRLITAGFRELGENDTWEDLAAGRYFVVHGGSTIVGFIVPAQAHKNRKVDGFRIVGAHTDSPNLRLKPKPEYTKEGYAQLGVEVYGGVLLSTWLDRDLSLAGRVFVTGTGNVPEPRLIRFDRPLLRVPALAIHLDRDVNDKQSINKQEHTPPVIALADGYEGLIALCAAELGIGTEAIRHLDLMLFDITAPVVGGAKGDFVFSARLDNLAMCHAGVTALVNAAPKAEAGATVPVVALFDHEEVGSESATGAQSAFLPRILERIGLAVGASRRDHLRALAGSSCVSADMAHAVHPNYADRHEARHKPMMNGGPVIKVNAQQRYATSAETAAMFAELCRLEDVPLQHYAHRTDLPCGSTIGPITSALLGIKTVDVGNPMLSMHSIREMGGARDPERMARVMRRYFEA